MISFGRITLINIINNTSVLVLRFKCSFEMKECSEIFLRMESLS